MSERLKEGKGNFSMKAIRKMVPLLGMIFTLILFTVITKGEILNSTNLSNVLDQSLVVIILSIGGAFVMAHGGMDFSLGAIVTAGSVMTGVMIKSGMPVIAAFAVLLVMALVSELVVSVASVSFEIPIFLTTLAGSYILRGAAESYMASKTVIYLPAEFSSIFNNIAIKGIVLVVLFAICYILFNRTIVGKYQMAIGGNGTVAALNGIKVKKYIVISHLIAGFCAAIATIFSVSRTGMVQATSGSGLELDVIVTLVLGGMPLSGGEKSNIQAAIIGALTISFLKNGLTLAGADVDLVEGITGLLFIICIAASCKRKAGEIIK